MNSSPLPLFLFVCFLRRVNHNYDNVKITKYKKRTTAALKEQKRKKIIILHLDILAFLFLSYLANKRKVTG